MSRSSTKLKVKVKVTLRLTVSQSVSLGVEPHLGLMTKYLAITIWQLRSCFCGAPSLTRERVCLLYMLLSLPNAVFLGSESLGTRDHILLSQIWDFPFRRLLRLAGSWWRYSTPPNFVPLITPRYGLHRKRSSIVACVYVLPNNGRCLPSRYPETGRVYQFISQSLHSNGYKLYNIMNVILIKYEGKRRKQI
jgi:hypothetical protein